MLEHLKTPSNSTNIYNKMKSERKTTIIRVPKGKYLSDVIKELPAGIFNKTETGIGATTLELMCNRHSIIVEPLKVTASSKAHKHNACYVGSPTKIHPEKNKSVNFTKIKNYMNDKSIKYKKFITVADSLGYLLSVLGDSLKDYFLLIDEADRTQLDVNFRTMMEIVLDIYKEHAQDKRCLLTATPIHYNDPELKAEPYTICEVDSPNRRKINFIKTRTGDGVIVDSVLDIYNKNDDKIVVAMNDITLSFEMAIELEKAGVDANEIQILCSSSTESKRKAGKFYNQIDSSKLSKKITFKTSAYFNGFDLDDRYHLFTYIQPKSNYHVHSDKTLMQIAGRCRDKNGLLSENIVYSKGYEPESYDHPYTLEELVESAQNSINLLECMKHHLKHNIVLKKQAEVLFGDVPKILNIYGYPLVSLKSKNPTVSFLSIDAILEKNKVINNQYCEPNAMYKVLSKENDVTFCTIESARKINTSNTKSISIADEKAYVDEILSKLIIDCVSKGEKHGHAPSIELLVSNDYSSAKYAFEIYEKFRLHVDNIQLKQHIINAFDSSKVKLQLKKLTIKLTSACADDNDTIKKELKTTFEYEKSYTSNQVKEHMLEIFRKLNITDVNSLKPQVLMERFNLMVKTSKTSKKGVKGKIFKIKGYNTLDIDVISSCKEHLTKSENFKLLVQSSLY